MKQKYFTVPLAICWWTIPLFIPLENDSLGGFIIFGLMLSVGALSDLDNKEK